mgnify:CR=1 FL=1
MNKKWIKNAHIINEGRSFAGSVMIEGDKITAVCEGEADHDIQDGSAEVILQDLQRIYSSLLPG